METEQRLLNQIKLGHDLDESLILDAMEGFIYKNDRQVKEKHIYWGLDKDNPRAEIEVSKIEKVLGN